jgi:probable HAF family extracellular repeat protein
MLDLGTLGGSNSFAEGINASGVIVGYSDMPGDTFQHAFIAGVNGVLIVNGLSTMADLGTLGGSNSQAWKINDSGQVVGYSDMPGNTVQHAFITGANGVGMTDLGTLGGTNSRAFGINTIGQVVGWSFVASGAGHAFVTGANGMGMIDLNSSVTLSGGDYFNSAKRINDRGQLTVETTLGHAYLLTPVVTPAISAGDNHTCVLTNAGAILCWGANGSGQLGTGTTTNSATPVAVAGFSSVASGIAAGYADTCAITNTGGAMQCWGSNIAGQIGNGSTVSPVITPTSITTPPNVVNAMATGGLHTCALDGTGGVWCWGAGSYGELGNGNFNSSTTPHLTVAMSSTGQLGIAAGHDHTCALTGTRRASS